MAVQSKKKKEKKRHSKCFHVLKGKIIGEELNGSTEWVTSVEKNSCKALNL